MMKVMLLGEGCIETGRGPLFRLLEELPFLAQQLDVFYTCLGPIDRSCREVIETHCTQLFIVPIHFDGWFVVNRNEIAKQISALVLRYEIDLVVLSWEIWDLMDALGVALAKTRAQFAVHLHSMPFLDAPARPSGSFYLDFFRRLGSERNPNVIRYCLSRIRTLRRVFDRLHVLSVNKTVDFYLRHYFPWLPFLTVHPGYALAVKCPKALVANDELIFMAKLVEGKGTFELPDLLARIVRDRPTRIGLVGSFESASDEKRFRNLLDRYGVANAVTFHGWVSGQRKYELLSSARLFLYPSLYSDTFSICLLEALACGLPAVCYDVPFVRQTYVTPSVSRVPLFDNTAFARTAVELLDAPHLEALRLEAVTFAQHYSSWEAVASADVRAFMEVCHAGPKTTSTRYFEERRPSRS